MPKAERASIEHPLGGDFDAGQKRSIDRLAGQGP
jgi:hypothetical protein